eukprot:scaffold93072_cov30-Phaeocystis_antarctica.AAC.1
MARRAARLPARRRRRRRRRQRGGSRVWPLALLTGRGLCWRCACSGAPPPRRRRRSPRRRERADPRPHPAACRSSSVGNSRPGWRRPPGITLPPD